MEVESPSLLTVGQGVVGAGVDGTSVGVGEGGTLGTGVVGADEVGRGVGAGVGLAVGLAGSFPNMKSVVPLGSSTL